MCMENIIVDFESKIEFIADIEGHKDCLMSQDSHQEDPKSLWFNIDVPKGHGLKAGDTVRIIVQKV